MSRQHKPVAATAPKVSTASRNANKKHSDRCYASQGSTTSGLKNVRKPELPYNAPKKLTTTGSIFTRRAPALDAGDKIENGKIRRKSCPPVATIGTKEQRLDGKKNGLPAKVKAVSSSIESASKIGGRSGVATIMNGTRKTDGKKEHMSKHRNRLKK
uniref:Uncharacterized protein n=1 Tax=Oryza punctata TaxID=4537 RepID=A0A0E0LXJ6_ORYPU